MIITAHGGALGTGRNSQKYFDTIANYKVDAIEVDIMKRGEVLYLAHILPPISLKRAIKLDYVFEFCKTHNFKVNCDVKQKFLVKPVLALAERMGATDFVYFTGTVLPEDVVNLTAGTALLNESFFNKKIPLRIDTLGEIKKYIDSFNNPRILGINIKYQYATNEFISKAKEVGLGLSLYTVDDVVALERIIKNEDKPYNVTTNLPDRAIDFLK
ncbi:MAG: hypothetical protein LBE09_09375 [Christensenellaceae bacterium]|jgi:hypothetical protein|nr:hypothetical protein [Christensenellaceae bacterium]